MEEFTGLGVIRAQINGQRIITPGDHKKISWLSGFSATARPSRAAAARA
jgi:hypothetical protein